MPRRHVTRWDVIDLGLATLVLLVGVLEIVSGQLAGPVWVSVAAVALMAASQLLRRRYVWAALVLSFGAIAGSFALGVSQGSFIASVVAALVVIATVGYSLPLRSALLALGFGFVCVVVSTARSPADVTWLVMVVGGPWLAGRALRNRHRLIEQLRATAAELEHSRHELADQAVAAERLRIARDVHDVIAHSVTVMTVQADAAERMLGRDDAQALESLHAVQDTGRAALTQLREMLGLLRPTAAGYAPQPGVDDIAALVAHFRRAGLDIAYEPASDIGDVSASAGIAAYWLVKEGLTNVLKHSAAQAATVVLTRAAGGVLVAVTDSGPARPGDDPGGLPPSGLGLIGMRERVHACGGRLVVAPTAVGGFDVRAVLPLVVA
jgi:signal transduction histidine kinase